MDVIVDCPVELDSGMSGMLIQSSLGSSGVEVERRTIWSICHRMMRPSCNST